MAGAALLLSGCETLDSAIKTADSAVNAVNTGTVKNITQIASSQDPAAALRQEAKDRADYYKRHPGTVLDDVKHDLGV